MLPLLIVSSARHLFPQFLRISLNYSPIWRDFCQTKTMQFGEMIYATRILSFQLIWKNNCSLLDCMDRGFPIFRRPFPTDWQTCVIYILFDCNRSQSMGLRATPTNCFFQSTLTDSLTQDKPLLLKSAKAETTFQDFCHKRTDFYTFAA